MEDLKKIHTITIFDYRLASYLLYKGNTIKDINKHSKIKDRAVIIFWNNNEINDNIKKWNDRKYKNKERGDSHN